MRPLRTRTYVGVEALPDTATIGRMQGLVAATTQSMRGLGSGIIGYDRGDPAHSFTGPLPAAQSPTETLAGMGSQSAIVPTPMSTDTLSPSTALDAYDAGLLARTQRR